MVEIDVSALTPQVTWGTNPGMVAPVDGVVPDPAAYDDPVEREVVERALRYMDLEPGTPIREIGIDRVFIGSCTNARIEDLRAAAAVVAGRHVAPTVRAMVVPGSAKVKRQAEAEGLDRVFTSGGLRVAAGGLLDVPRHEPGHPRSRASAARRPRTGTSRAARARAAGRTWSLRRWPQRPRVTGRFTDVQGARDEGAPPGHGRVAVLDRADVDTDQIIPKQFLKRIERSGYGEFLFYDWMKDPDFELHRPEYQGAQILVAGRNFGCGSSREHAAWALEDYGFRASSRRASATSSARTRSSPASRRSSCPRPSSTRSRPRVAQRNELTVDLEALEITHPDGLRVPIELDDYARETLVHGLDDVARTLRARGADRRLRGDDAAALRHDRARRLTPRSYRGAQWELRAIGWWSSEAASAGCSRPAG